MNVATMARSTPFHRPFLTYTSMLYTTARNFSCQRQTAGFRSLRDKLYNGPVLWRSNTCIQNRLPRTDILRFYLHRGAWWEILRLLICLFRTHLRQKRWTDLAEFCTRMEVCTGHCLAIWSRSIMYHIASVLHGQTYIGLIPCLPLRNLFDLTCYNLGK